MVRNLPTMVVVGGGPVGLALGLACRGIANIRIIENIPPPPPLDPGSALDHRIYALTPASQALLASLGVWRRLRLERMQPVQGMEVWGDDRARPLRFEHRAPLAWMLEHAALMNALWAEVRTHDIEVITGVRPAGLLSDPAPATGHTVTLQNGIAMHADLVAGADGAQSWVRLQAGMSVQEKAYDADGVVANFRCARDHQGVARQWFAGGTVLAWLPLPDRCMSMVWSVPSARATALCSMPPEQLCREVGEAGDETLGTLELISPVARFPLRRILADDCVAPGIALVGDAAHTIHPLAGQGVNLGFGDVSSLSQLLADRGPLQGPGALPLLQRYRRARREQVVALAALTDQLQGWFQPATGPWPVLRTRGMAVLERQDWLKRAMMHFAMR